MTEPQKLSLASMNITEEKKEQLKLIFPEVFTENKIDFDQLKRVLGEWVEPGKERFGLQWPGKAECMKIIQQPSVATLKPCREESVNFDETENLFIEGDNLEVLKLLQKSYFGKIKMIYIDPPYNTGKEFIYPDKYSETLDTYLAYTGQVDDSGKKFSTNTEAQGRFHSRWLNMMYPRLYLARNLLREDGVIFISIDDHEADNLKKMCSEIFGEDNFVALFVWEKRTTRENRRVFSFNHEYVMCFAKNKTEFEQSRNLLPITDEVRDRYSNPDNDPRGLWQSVSLNAQAGHATKDQFYSLTTPSGRVIDPPPGRCWAVTKRKMEEIIADNRVWFGETGNNTPRRKMFLSEAKDGLTPHTLWSAEEVGTNDSAKKKLIEIFDGVEVFDTPKPIALIRRMLEIATDKSDLVLDFFAGSGPMAEATLDLNNQDSGSRRFILVQLPETTEHKDFPTISAITKERIRRVIKKMNAESVGTLNLDNRSILNFGFKAFRLDRSNFKVWEGNVEKINDLAEQLTLHVDHIAKQSSPEDILYEILLKAGFSLTTKIKKLAMAGKQVFSIEDGAMLICLEKEITPELIDALADAEPLQVICLDEAFKSNDQLKTNAVQTFKARAQAKESEIVFRTV